MAPDWLHNLQQTAIASATLLCLNYINTDDIHGVSRKSQSRQKTAYNKNLKIYYYM